MLGNMMQQQLLISSILQHASRQFPNQQVVSRRVEGDIHRYTFRELANRAARLANALKKFGVKPGDRIASLAWNTYRHLELYYATSGIETIIHTVNPRLFNEQIDYIINHAEDRIVFTDLTFITTLEALGEKLPSIEAIVVFADRQNMPKSSLQNLICYEDFISNEPSHFDWPSFDENTAACLCYTSGTTGNPKGVLYSHRSTVLHAMASCMPNGLNLSSDTIILPVVPMYHVSAWGTPYSALLAGSKLVLPGNGMDGASLYELIDSEKCELLLGVPTVWLNLLEYMDKVDKKLTSVKTLGVGGAQAPLALAKAFEEKHDAYLMPLWGMTETSPLATFVTRNKAIAELPLEQRYAMQTKAGRPIFGVEIEIFDDQGQPLVHDGKVFGNLKIRGPWVLQKYYLKTESAVSEDGWFDTGDVATIDTEGYMQVVDRKKDVIKSGGEWISSIDLENAAIGHTAVKEACVVGVPHKKWDERPLLFIVCADGAQLSKDEILEYLSEKIVKWWIPDDVIFLDDLPHTATGKLLKMKLREEYKDYLL